MHYNFLQKFLTDFVLFYQLHERMFVSLNRLLLNDYLYLKAGALLLEVFN